MKTTRTYYREILLPVFLFMMTMNLDTREIENVVSEAIVAARKKLSRRAKTEPANAYYIGAVFYRWFRERRYLDAQATPKAIRLRGRPPSVAALLRSEGIRGKAIDAFLTQIISLKLVREVDERKFTPVGPVAVFRDIGPEVIEHVAASFARLLSTVEHNTTPANRHSPLIERAASVPDLPVAEVPAFREFTRQQARSFLASIDDWLETKRRLASPKRRSQKVRSAGVHVYAYLS